MQHPDLAGLDPVAVAMDDRPEVWEKHPYNVAPILAYKYWAKHYPEGRDESRRDGILSRMQRVLQDIHQAVFAALDREGGVDALTQAAVPLEPVGGGMHARWAAWDVRVAIQGFRSKVICGRSMFMSLVKVQYCYTYTACICRHALGA